MQDIVRLQQEGIKNIIKKWCNNFRTNFKGKNFLNLLNNNLLDIKPSYTKEEP